MSAPINYLSVSAVNKIVQDVAAIGGRLYYSRVDQFLFADAFQQLPYELVLRIEVHKVAVLQAIAGKLGYVATSDAGVGGGTGSADTGISGLGISDNALQMLIDLLRERGDEILPSDEVTKANLNKHKYTFDPKFDAIAATFEALKSQPAV